MFLKLLINIAPIFGTAKTSRYAVHISDVSRCASKFWYPGRFDVSTKVVPVNRRLLLFSSPGTKCQGELLGWSSVCRPSSSSSSSVVRRPSSVVNNLLKHLLLWNYWWESDQTWHRCSLDGLLWKLLKWFHSMKNSGCHGNQKKNLWKSSSPKLLARF